MLARSAGRFPAAVARDGYARLPESPFFGRVPLEPQCPARVWHLFGTKVGAIVSTLLGLNLPTLKMSEDLRPLTDLKSEAGDIVGQVERTGRPVVITRHGRGVAVILSLAAFEEMQARMETGDLRRALAEGEEDVRAGRLLTHAEVASRHGRAARG
ncbi:MAG: type II toxin-antitoxin system Phd/YefM family antitoxin [Deltaproteobacteria bacterium]|nr:type II toxin-antitoxin system Phd/YefM family antitoxin [Deltaproteobacteria bacterium]